VLNEFQRIRAVAGPNIIKPLIAATVEASNVSRDKREAKELYYCALINGSYYKGLQASADLFMKTACDATGLSIHHRLT
jgi:hypothetical protein